MKNRSYLLMAAAAALTVVVTGCASVSVQSLGHEQALYKNTPQVKPTAIYVIPFDTTKGEWNVDREGSELTAFKQNLQQMMADAIVERINKHLVSSRVVYSVPPAGNYWVVVGEFTRVNQGSRLLRSTVGFGAGGTKLETKVAVYDMSQGGGVPFLSFATTGGSGASPGMISAGPVGAAVGVVGGISKGLTEDTNRTSRMITANLSSYMHNEGWISKEEALSPKVKGD